MRVIRLQTIPAGTTGAFQIDIEAQIQAGVLQFNTTSSAFTQWVEGWLSVDASTKWSFDFVAGTASGSSLTSAATLITIGATSIVGSISVDYPNGIVTVNVTANTTAFAVDFVVDATVVTET